MGKIRIRNHEFATPDIARLVKHSLGETLIYCGPATFDSKAILCMGVGKVNKVQKGNKFDLVTMFFGRISREIIVVNNHARRQIFTLKVGQYASFVGYATAYAEDGKQKLQLYAKGLQGWFVPKTMDIKKIDPNDIEQMTEENESKINFIEELIGDDDDEL